jgi:multiple sugar transport system ATP-binding protein
MSKIEFRNVYKLYGSVEAVIDVSWECKDGEFFSILGPSGCGKSSTLRMIAGLEKVSRGEIYFNDRCVNKLKPSERNIALVFENWALYPNLSVYENIAFPLRIRNLPEKDIDKKVGEAIKFLNLEDVLHHNVKKLSGGEMQRVSVGRAIVRDPAVMLMDEPISHLDASLREKMRDELKRKIVDLGMTTIYVTHDQEEAMSMADRILIMDNGCVQQIAKPLDIYNNPSNEFVAGFIGEPSMNFTFCELIREGDKYIIKSPTFVFNLDKILKKTFLTYSGRKKLKMGIRPEDVMVSVTEKPGSTAMEVDFVERKGDSTTIIMKLNEGELFFAQLMQDLKLKIGQRIYITFNQRKLHFFDIESGYNIFNE